MHESKQHILYILDRLYRCGGNFGSLKFVDCKSVKAAGVFQDNAWMGDLRGTAHWLDNQ